MLADCEVLIAGFYDLSLAGAELPLLRRGARSPARSGRTASRASRSEAATSSSSSAAPGSGSFGAVELRRLVESEDADVVVGPGFVPIGLEMVEYAKHRPETTFVVTSWEALTHFDPGGTSSASPQATRREARGWDRTRTTCSAGDARRPSPTTIRWAGDGARCR